MPTIKIVNLKCGGCENSIKLALEKDGFRDVKIDINTQEVSFAGDADRAKKILEKLGYPEKGSKAEKSLIKKAKSYGSCMIGRIKK